MTAVRRVTTADYTKAGQPIQAAVYIRWSTEDQGKGWTKEVQLEACKKKIAEKGWAVDEELMFIDDGYTGENMHRPGLTTLRQAIKQGKVQAVVVYRQDRLSRSVADTSMLVVREWNNEVLFVSCTEADYDTSTQTGRQMLYMGAIIAESERENIKVRTMAGKRKNAENGKNPGVIAPFGYTSENGAYTIVAEEALIVKRIFELSLTRGISAIAKLLNDEGVSAPRDKGWTHTTVGYILSNKFYIGVFDYGKKRQNKKRYDDESQPFWVTNNEYLEVAGFIEPMIDEKLFYAAQEAISGRTPRKGDTSGRGTASEYLLTGGIAYCGICENRLSAYKKSDSGKMYYQCRNHRDKGNSVCTAGFVPMEEANEWVLEQLDKDLLSTANQQKILDKMLAGNQDKVTIKENLIHELERKIETRQKRKNEIVRDYVTAEPEVRMSQENYNMALNYVTEELAELHAKLNAAKTEYDVMVQSLEDTTQMEQYIEKYRHFREMPIEQQKDLLRKIIVKVTIKAEKGNTRDYTMETRYPKPE